MSAFLLVYTWSFDRWPPKIHSVVRDSCRWRAVCVDSCDYAWWSAYRTFACRLWATRVWHRSTTLSTWSGVCACASFVSCWSDCWRATFCESSRRSCEMRALVNCRLDSLVAPDGLSFATVSLLSNLSLKSSLTHLAFRASLFVSCYLLSSLLFCLLLMFFLFFRIPTFTRNYYEHFNTS